MKAITILFCIFFLNHAIAQDIYVMDKSDETNLVFDDENPLSLLSLIKSKSSYFEKFFFKGIAPEDFDKLSADEQKKFEEYIGQPGTTPIMVEDPDSPDFGNPLIVTDPATGMQSFVYEAPDTFRINLTGIDRAIFELDRYGSDSVNVVTGLTFCRQYDNRYVPVLTLRGENLLSMSGFDYLRGVSEEESERLLSDSDDSYWSSLKKYQEFTKAGFISRNFYWYRLEEPYIGDLGESPEFGLNLYFENRSESMVDSLKMYFDSVEYEWYQPSVPLINTDVNSPDFGTPLIVVDSVSGMQYFVYDPPYIEVQWLHFKPALFISEELTVEGNNLIAKPKTIYFTKKVNGVYEIAGFHSLSSVYHPANASIDSGGLPVWLDAYFSDLKPSSDWNEWKSMLTKAINTNTVKYSLLEEGVYDKLRLSPSYGK